MAGSLAQGDAILLEGDGEGAAGKYIEAFFLCREEFGLHVREMVSVGRFFRVWGGGLCRALLCGRQLSLIDTLRVLETICDIFLDSFPLGLKEWKSGELICILEIVGMISRKSAFVPDFCKVFSYYDLFVVGVAQARGHGMADCMDRVWQCILFDFGDDCDYDFGDILLRLPAGQKKFQLEGVERLVSSVSRSDFSPSEAVCVLKFALIVCPTCLDAAQGLYLRSLELGRLDEAVVDLRKACEAAGYAGYDVQYVLGSALYTANRVGEATNVFAIIGSAHQQLDFTRVAPDLGKLVLQALDLQIRDNIQNCNYHPALKLLRCVISSEYPRYASRSCGGPEDGNERFRPSFLWLYHCWRGRIYSKLKQHRNAADDLLISYELESEKLVSHLRVLVPKAKVEIVASLYAVLEYGEFSAPERARVILRLILNIDPLQEKAFLKLSALPSTFGRSSSSMNLGRAVSVEDSGSGSQAPSDRRIRRNVRRITSTFLDSEGLSDGLRIVNNRPQQNVAVAAGVVMTRVQREQQHAAVVCPGAEPPKARRKAVSTHAVAPVDGPARIDAVSVDKAGDFKPEDFKAVDDIGAGCAVGSAEAPVVVRSASGAGSVTESSIEDSSVAETEGPPKDADVAHFLPEGGTVAEGPPEGEDVIAGTADGALDRASGKATVDGSCDGGIAADSVPVQQGAAPPVVLDCDSPDDVGLCIVIGTGDGDRSADSEADGEELNACPRRADACPSKLKGTKLLCSADDQDVAAQPGEALPDGHEGSASVALSVTFGSRTATPTESCSLGQLVVHSEELATILADDTPMKADWRDVASASLAFSEGVRRDFQQLDFFDVPVPNGEASEDSSVPPGDSDARGLVAAAVRASESGLVSESVEMFVCAVESGTFENSCVSEFAKLSAGAREKVFSSLLAHSERLRKKWELSSRLDDFQRQYGEYCDNLLEMSSHVANCASSRVGLLLERALLEFARGRPEACAQDVLSALYNDEGRLRNGPGGAMGEWATENFVAGKSLLLVQLETLRNFARHVACLHSSERFVCEFLPKLGDVEQRVECAGSFASVCDAGRLSNHDAVCLLSCGHILDESNGRILSLLGRRLLCLELWLEAAGILVLRHRLNPHVPASVGNCDDVSALLDCGLCLSKILARESECVEFYVLAAKRDWSVFRDRVAIDDLSIAVREAVLERIFGFANSLAAEPATSFELEQALKLISFLCEHRNVLPWTVNYAVCAQKETRLREKLESPQADSTNGISVG